MNETSKIKISFKDGYYITNGLKNIIDTELRVVNKIMEEKQYYKVIQYIIDYILEYNQYPKAGENIAYYSWLLKFVESDDNYLDLWEVNDDGEDFIEGVENAIEIVENQINLCDKYEEYANFPLFNQMVVISKGVYEGLYVEAVRYLPEDNMSGWWITTDLYDDNIDSLMVVHYHHLAFSRPDLLRYLALPAGYRFFIEGENVEIYLDEKVLEG